MTFRRLLTVTLALLLLTVVGVLGYPYARYRAVSVGNTRGFEDRWSGTASSADPDYIVSTISSRDGELTFEIVDQPDGGILRKIGAEGAVLEVAVEVGDVTTIVSFAPDGSFLEGIRRKGPRLGTPFQQLTEAEAREIAGPLLEPDGMPWPWWTKFPGFRKHLSP